MFFTSPMHVLVSLVVSLAVVTVSNGFSSRSALSNATIASESSTTIQGVVWTTQPVTITIAANVTEVETFYPGGGASNYTTFTLTGPTTFITSYIDGIDVLYVYSTTVFRFTVASGIGKTETLVSSVDTGHLTGDYRSGGFPWEIDTTFILTGPIVYATQGVMVGLVEMDSPPYVLQSSPATNLDVKTTATTVASSTAAPSPIYTATVFNPLPASSSPASSSPVSWAPLSTLISYMASSFVSHEQESSAFVVAEGTIIIQAQSTTANLPHVTGSEVLNTPTPSAVVVPSKSLVFDSQSGLLPSALVSHLTVAGLPASVLNPSAIIIGSQTLNLNSPAVTVASLFVSLNSADIIVGSSTIPFSTPSISPFSPPVITIGTELITLLSSAIALDGTTLSPGAVGVSIAGTFISLGTSALVVGSKTEVFISSTETVTAGLGLLILSGLGQIVTSSVAPVTTSAFHKPSNSTFVGGSQRTNRLIRWWSGALSFLIGLGLY
ncbi:Muc22p [Xylographa trunciseda]|nr:Muc22p [Xylographa trunciseda]